MKPSLAMILSACVVATAAVGARAQELKIGYVSTERIMRESMPAKAAFAKLEGEFGKREKELTEQANKIRAAGEKLEKDSTTLSEPERTRRQRDVVDQDREWQRKRREYQEDLTQRKNDETAKVFERAEKVIRQIFESEKYDLIMQEAVVDSTGRPLVSARVDITEKVIKALNAQGSK